jgi:hypothetical protein
VGFCAVGTGGVDFSLGGHGCTELSLGDRFRVDRGRIWEWVEMGEIEVGWGCDRG